MVLCNASYLFLHKRFVFLDERFLTSAGGFEVRTGSKISYFGRICDLKLTDLYCLFYVIHFVFMLLISMIRCKQPPKGCMKSKKKLMKGKNWFPIYDSLYFADRFITHYVAALFY